MTKIFSDPPIAFYPEFVELDKLKAIHKDLDARVKLFFKKRGPLSIYCRDFDTA